MYHPLDGAATVSMPQKCFRCPSLYNTSHARLPTRCTTTCTARCTSSSTTGACPCTTPDTSGRGLNTSGRFCNGMPPCCRPSCVRYVTAAMRLTAPPRMRPWLGEREDTLRTRPQLTISVSLQVVWPHDPPITSARLPSAAENGRAACPKSTAPRSIAPASRRVPCHASTA